MKIAAIVGARPQFIKLAPLSKQLGGLHEEIIIHTGQHFDRAMSDIFFSQLGIAEPQFNLSIHDGSHGNQTGRMIIALEQTIKAVAPQLVIVFGDTNSTLAGALTAAKLNIPLVHIEAGLRSFNTCMPEEINRIVTDHCSDHLFAPTSTAVDNLRNEGLSAQTWLTGDIMVDALLDSLEKARSNSTIKNKLHLDRDGYYLLTLHRPYNVDDPAKLQQILERLSELDTTIVFPVHPRTKNVLLKNNIDVSRKIVLVNPLGYLDFMSLEESAIKILTDSGGIQKEAYILKKPCITIRSETEWVETVEDGWNVLAIPENEDFVDTIRSFNPREKQRDVFGKNVASKMVEIINNIALR